MAVSFCTGGSHSGSHLGCKASGILEPIDNLALPDILQPVFGFRSRGYSQPVEVREAIIVVSIFYPSSQLHGLSECIAELRRFAMENLCICSEWSITHSVIKISSLCSYTHRPEGKKNDTSQGDQNFTLWYLMKSFPSCKVEFRVFLTC